MAVRVITQTGMIPYSAVPRVQKKWSGRGAKGPQVQLAKQRVVGLAAYLNRIAGLPQFVSLRTYVQSHITQLETDLSKIDSALNAKVPVAGYPLKT